MSLIEDVGEFVVEELPRLVRLGLAVVSAIREGRISSVEARELLGDQAMIDADALRLRREARERIT